MSATPDNTLANPEQRIADLERQLAEREAELAEALAQQAATTEVLQVINSSPGDLTPVFAAMLEKATRLCEADFGIMNTYDGEHLNPVALHRVPPAYAKLVSELPPPSVGVAMRIVRGEDVVHIADATASLGYLSGEILPRALVEVAGVRSDVAVALRKDGRLLGSAPLARQTPHDARYVPATGRRRSRCHFGKKSCSGHEPPISVHRLATSRSQRPAS